MAAQTFVSDMQAINATPVQQVQQTTSTQSQSSQSQTATLAIQKVVTTQGIQIQPAQAQQQFITVTISGEHNSEQNNQETVQLQQVQQGSNQTAVYPAHVQQNYTEFNQPTMYSTQYYQASPSQGGGSMPAGISQVGGIQHQILTQHGGTYLVQGGAMDGEGTPLTHTTRASPATEASQQKSVNFDTKCWQREFMNHEDGDVIIPGFSTSKTHKAVVQWLIDNYETAEGVSLPRSTLYSHYLRHCQEQKMDPMNPASFGKLIRSVFLGLRTRRLGTRGNSKYHYYGIRIKAMSPLNQFTDEQTMALRQQPMNQGKSFARFKQGMVKGEGADDNSYSGQSDGPYTQHQKHQQFLGDASGAIPNFGTIETGTAILPDGIDQENIRAFENLYKEHCEAILDVVVNLQFSLIEALWQSFWRNSPVDQQDGDCESEALLPKEKLYLMGKIKAVQDYVRRSDFAFYQALVEVLIPDVLRPIPSSLTQAIRNFAKSLEGWLKGSMTGVPEEMVKTKVSAVSAFAQTLRRYTSLNHLAQAARAVLQNTSQINQMLTDLNRVDFANVQEQASWVCQCDDSVVHQLEQDFKKTLQQQNSLEQWAEWLEDVVTTVLKPHEGSPNFPKAARQFLLKWSFYSSMVIRDLTLRSAASFGSFHLIRLLYDEFMFYLVEHKVASATGETPIAVMGEVRQFIDLSGVMAIGTMDSEPAKSIQGTIKINTQGASSVERLHNGSAAPIAINTAGSIMSDSAKSAAGTIKINTQGASSGERLHNGSATPITINTTGSNTQTITVMPSSQQSSQLSYGTATISGATPVVINTGTTNASSGPATVTVLATGTPSHGHGTKTIVVVPVSAAGDAAPRPAKIAKTS